ncbi:MULTISPECIES: iron ABC transporter ATP-binding protein [unclassified Romboutsia]|uniref:iron ABC transporter ATP-binding protein n=1 Tax=unclassified Romboutsia TaxID=2626894 RepID=UPI0018AA9052|nr:MULTISPECIES: ATP-binding cassette domain-containing protein [unclassified Romboutsia]MDB8805188.1 ATP-binding cassette domain-containing protein [Romboutsia sp. 1001216sp1]MDB8807138.1 ATP-binding cassette domain-containing protein [Romboutsia sp. 1001216sp1]MDB8810833.1 ATP-binding cassette domain-containing protein [Romboutsia sp. 1001216sp1]MDB8816553.1 ATP-binding cassette domain-containing protein [Romboutsia sp. 1001216sp1]MDB8819162.1 ATP-binding cassette domain-containing protein [
MIVVKDIIKKYSNKPVVDNVSINIEKGKITSFIGPNGAGKSTALSIITRLMKKDGGEVIIDGKRLEDWDNKELSTKIAILKQSNHINLKLTIRELVAFGRFPHSQGRLTEEDNKYIDEAIEYMKLKDIEDRYLDELSGGQRQRAYIAMVIAQNTEYVFLDEPLNNLDMKHSVEMMKVLRNLCDELGKTVILVMHDINYTSCYSDYIVALKDGKIARYGKTDEIIKKEVLEEIYEMEFDIQEINGDKICIYF